MITNLHIYKLIFENAREGLLLTDNRGIIELVNPRILEIFKYEYAEELLGKPIELLIPRELRRKHVQHRIDYYQRPDDSAKNIYRPLTGSCKDDSRVLVDVSLSYFHNEDGEIKVLSFVNDITDIVHTEEALKREKELNELKSRFVSMVSHEIRTPLSSIYTSATLIAKYKAAEQQDKREKHTERIKHSVKYLTALLEDVLSLQRLEDEAGQIEAEFISFPDTVKKIIHDFFPSEGDINRIVYRHHGKDSFYTERKVLAITITNLLDNALKYSPDSSSVKVTTRCGSKGLYISVRDEGMGIPEKEQAGIFDRFFRASNAVHIRGTGLGLSIVRGMLKKLGGDIIVDSIPGVFTEFKVSIPIIPSPLTTDKSFTDSGSS